MPSKIRSTKKHKDDRFGIENGSQNGGKWKGVGEVLGDFGTTLDKDHGKWPLGWHHGNQSQDDRLQADSKTKEDVESGS